MDILFNDSEIEVKIKFKYPIFVRMGHTCLRLTFNPFEGYHYHRDAGDWNVQIVEKDGKFYTESSDDSLNDVELITTNLDTWRTSNGEWAASDSQIVEELHGEDMPF